MEIFRLIISWVLVSPAMFFIMPPLRYVNIYLSKSLSTTFLKTLIYNLIKLILTRSEIKLFYNSMQTYLCWIIFLFLQFYAKIFILNYFSLLHSDRKRATYPLYHRTCSSFITASWSGFLCSFFFHCSFFFQLFFWSWKIKMLHEFKIICSQLLQK